MFKVVKSREKFSPPTLLYLLISMETTLDFFWLFNLFYEVLLYMETRSTPNISFYK